MGERLDADADQFLNFIVAAAVRMSALVRDLLAYARVTAEEGRPSSIALDEDLEAALTHLDQAIKERVARASPTIPCQPCRWIADRWFGCFKT